jgi:uncharacterized membrane protein YgcG
MTTIVQAAASAASQAVSSAVAASTPDVPASAVTAGGLLASTNLPVIALAGVIATVMFAGYVLLRLPVAPDIETQKIRFAATTFTGILIVFVFAAILYFGDPGAKNAGKDIFEKAITAMTPLIGVIVGYLFGAKSPASGSGSGNSGGGGITPGGNPGSVTNTTKSQ